MLKVGLGKARHDVSWVNIWQDEEAAAYVRTRRDGNETVPTAVTGDGELLASDAATIKDHLIAG